MTQEPLPISDLTGALNAFVENVQRTILEPAMQVIKRLHETVYQQYLEAGAPYGESHEGCQQWMLDLAEKRRLQAAIDEIDTAHRALVERRKLEEKVRRKHQNALKHGQVL